MSLRTVGKKQYGDNHDDIAESLRRYGLSRQETVSAFANAVCLCDGETFRLFMDEEEGVAVRECVLCARRHTMGDGDDYLAEATLEDYACLCGAAAFQITVGVNLYRDSEDVRWFYVGCRCVACSLVGCYGDWKNEHINYETLLVKV